MAFSMYTPKEWNRLPADLRLRSVKTKLPFHSSIFLNEHTIFVRYVCLYGCVDVSVYLFLLTLFCFMHSTLNCFCMIWCYTNTFEFKFRIIHWFTGTSHCTQAVSKTTKSVHCGHFDSTIQAIHFHTQTVNTVHSILYSKQGLISDISMSLEDNNLKNK